MYDLILVPIDGSDPADAAATYAIGLARRFDATVSILSVAETEAPPMFDIEPPDVSGRDALGAETEQSIETAAHRADDAGVPCRITVERGTPHEIISAHAADADLVVMGTHGRTGLQRLLLGSVTARVLRTSDAPVLTTGADEGAPVLDSVLVPTDGSRCATRAVDHGLALAERYDATLHAISVVDAQTIAATYHGGGVTAEFVDALVSDREDVVEAVADRASERGVDVETTVINGSPGRAIERYTDDQEIDLVSMGTHGRSGADRYLLGSVAERTVRSSDAPVLAVPPAE